MSPQADQPGGTVSSHQPNRKRVTRIAYNHAASRPSGGCAHSKCAYRWPETTRRPVRTLPPDRQHTETGAIPISPGPISLGGFRSATQPEGHHDHHHPKLCGERGQTECPDCGSYQLLLPTHPAKAAIAAAADHARQLADSYHTPSPEAAQLADIARLSARTTVNYLRRAMMTAGELLPERS